MMFITGIGCAIVMCGAATILSINAIPIVYTQRKIKQSWKYIFRHYGFEISSSIGATLIAMWIVHATLLLR